MVELSFFKTIFTTNFDDLINEAFYLYSIERPLVCAHDSTIGSITITSKRPKIIKLHGDYLFDDIKSTLSETESLGENIKNKFIEFAKDFGLIVIGYGGNDRSIVDVLTFLLKNEDYFKHGIYWCLREDSEINEDLRKLLWKDRVYFVKIQGFDELFAECHSNVNANSLPIDNSYLNKRKNDLIHDIVNNPYLSKSSNRHIINDLERLRKNLAHDVVNNFFQFLNSNDAEIGDSKYGLKKKEKEKKQLTQSEKFTLNNIKQEIIMSNFDFALVEISKHLEKIDKSSKFYEELLEEKATCHRNTMEKNIAIDCYKKIIKLEKGKIKNYVRLSRLLDDFQEKIRYIDGALQLAPYDASLHNEKCKIILDHLEKGLIAKIQKRHHAETVKTILSESLTLNPSIRNQAWSLELDLYRDLLGETDFFEKKKAVLNGLEKQDPLNPIVVRLKCETQFHKKERLKEKVKYVKDCIEKSYSPETRAELEFLLLNILSEENCLEELRDRIDFIENNYEINSEFVKKKAVFMLEKFDDLPGAIKTLESIPQKTKPIYQVLFDYLLFHGEYSRAEKILKKELPFDDIRKINLSAARGDNEMALKKVIEMEGNGKQTKILALLKSYFMLVLGRNQEAIKVAKAALEIIGFDYLPLLVNYYLGKKKINDSYNPGKYKEKLLQIKGISLTEKAAAYAVIGDENNAIKVLKDGVMKDKTVKYLVRDWIVFAPYINKKSFKSVLGL